ncbi:cytochrome c oxidase subunit 3 [Halobacillus shinanisalinarum]|uniref:Cytochrome c oxidase subunit 3 n=1 Tax=Halobacillus shinanisalinarum TaxID=2932258 RepID=A0ABY4H3K1_9BACI|nr:cytochrome c oxidase subunit 3 [Halobacillus shinanisalinarum]UOQ95038.1 cytochrome c oxidase subunit 3 [Halobacillus shinanisalinarum]
MSHPASQNLFGDKRLGFFIYLGVEAVMFATLFATYIIFTPASQGADPSEVFELRSVVLASIFLLSSSGTLLMAEKGMENGSRMKIWVGLIATFLLGAVFLGLEIHEFYKYVHEGYVMSMNNFLASFYVLVGLHASHVAFGLGWMILLMFQLRQDLPKALLEEKQKIFSYYWHFVDFIWIMIIIFVYAPYMF